MASGGASDSPPAKRGRPRVRTVLSRYPAFSLIDDGDDVAVARNLKALAKELGESTPRKDVVLSLTKQTFHSRRERILSESEELSFSMLLEEFPSFSRPYVVSQTGILGEVRELLVQ